MLKKATVTFALGLLLSVPLTAATHPATGDGPEPPVFDYQRYDAALAVAARIQAEYYRELAAWSEYYRIAWITESEAKARVEAARIQEETDAYVAQLAAVAEMAGVRATAARASASVAPAVATSTVVVAALTAASSLASLAIAAGWPAELAGKVERVAQCESGGQTGAVSPAGYVGLMQVAPWLHGGVPADAVGQLAQAYRVYLAQGWGAWPVCGAR